MLWSASNLAVYLPRREYKTFSKALLLRIELMIAMHHGWRLMMIVPTDYLDLFKVVSVTNTDILFEAAYAVVRNSPRYGGVTYDDLKKDQNRLNFLAETAKMDVNRFIDIIYTVVMRCKFDYKPRSLIYIYFVLCLYRHFLISFLILFLCSGTVENGTSYSILNCWSNLNALTFSMWNAIMELPFPCFNQIHCERCPNLL